MKTLLALLLWSFLSAMSVLAQEQPPYGPVGIVAVSNESGHETAMQFGRVLSDVLHKEEKVTVRGGVEFVSAKDANEAELLQIANKLAVDWLVVSTFQPEDKDPGIVNVEVLHAISKKIVARTTAVVGTIRTYGAKVGEEIYHTALNAAHVVTALVSQFKEVWVILQFLSSPTEANYVFGKSSSKVTDKSGAGYWEGTQSVGKISLRVWKPGYSSQTTSIDIPSQGSAPYVVPLQVISLQPVH